MSSLNATQADGYYIPPSYLDSGAYKKQSVSKFNTGSKGHNQYLQRSVVRFELPYDGFCLGCDAHVARGTRFNAHKAHVGDYFSTKIYEFTFRCRACQTQVCKVRTNPQGRCFDYVDGMKRKVEEFDTAEAGTLGVVDTDAGDFGTHRIVPGKGPDEQHEDQEAKPSEPSSSSALERLETYVVGERKALSEHDHMVALMAVNRTSYFDDSTNNAKLRSTYRTMRKATKKQRARAVAAGLGQGHIQLSEKCTREEELMAAAAFHPSARDDLEEAPSAGAKRRQEHKWRKLQTASIFANASSQKQRRHVQTRKRPKRPRQDRNNSSESLSSPLGTSTPMEATDHPRSLVSQLEQDAPFSVIQVRSRKRSRECASDKSSDADSISHEEKEETAVETPTSRERSNADSADDDCIAKPTEQPDALATTLQDLMGAYDSDTS